MSDFRKNLTRARSHIVMVLALFCGLGLILWLEGINLAPTGTADPLEDLAAMVPQPLAMTRPLKQTDVEAARIAWRFFQNNISPETGLTGSVHGYPSTTMWETGSMILAIIAAERVGLIQPEETVARIRLTLASLSRMPLLKDRLPNKAYDIRSLRMVNYQNKPTDRGIGWSALDIGRLLTALRVAETAHPELAVPIAGLLRSWDLSRALKLGELNGMNIKDGQQTEHQEGRVGYEQYAAKAFLAYGLDATRAMDVAGHLMLQDVDGTAVPVDSRLNRNMVPAMTTSEPYLLDGLEFGFDWRSHLFATQVYRAQEQRFAQTGKLTALSEGHIDTAPYFAYATIWSGGQSWSVLTFTGERLDSKRTLSTKAAFGWDALFNTPYTHKLVADVAALKDPEKGWHEGRYEIDGKPNTSITANTNAMILSAMAFRATGPLLKGAE